MQYKKFSKDISNYELGNGYQLIQVDKDTNDFVHHWAAYRPNEGYHLDWTTRYSDLKGVPFCYWITKNGQCLGGCLMMPNVIAELFLIPPHNKYEEILSCLLPLLDYWSDEEQAIRAMYVLPEQIAVLEQHDFRIVEQRRWMIRPVTRFQVDFEPNYQAVYPEIADLDEITEIFVAAFSGGIGEYGRRDYHQHKQSIQKYFDTHPLLDASLILRDEQTGQIVSVCLVSEFAGHATIQFIVTHPDYQGKGIGTSILQYAINKLYGTYLWVTLAVTVGNPAESLYQNLGFKPNIPISTMIR